MADPNNPYCRPSFRASPFYSVAPRKESLYDRGNLGPPIYGEYRDRWNGKQWIRGDGSRAPLSGFGYTPEERMAIAMNTRGAASTSKPFVAQKSMMNVGTCQPGYVRTEVPGGAPVCLEAATCIGCGGPYRPPTTGGATLFSVGRMPGKRNALYIGLGAAALVGGYLLLRKK